MSTSAKWLAETGFPEDSDLLVQQIERTLHGREESVRKVERFLEGDGSSDATSHKALVQGGD